MRLPSLAALCLASLAACESPSQPAADAAPDLTDAPRDATPDVAADAAPDSAPDVAPDVMLDAAPDVAPDVTLDAAPDVAPDAALDAARDATADALDVADDRAPVDAAPEAGACRTDADCAAGNVCAAGVCAPCGDADGDGLSDMIEGAPTTDTDRDGTPDFRDTDSDDDGFSDAVEAARRYPGFDAMARAVTCGGAPDNCDATGDRAANHRDLDSDDDGVTDAAERAARTNPCAADTDGDGVSDLVETAAGTDPTASSSRLPQGSLVVTLPYRAPSPTAPRERLELAMATRVRAVDVMFVVDASGSTQPAMEGLRQVFTRSLAPSLRAQFADVRVGAATFVSMPLPPQGCPGAAGPPTTSSRCPSMPTTAGDYTLWMRQPMTADLAAAQRAFDAMRTIGEDTGSAFVGGDAAECHTEAMFQVLEGTGTRGHESDPLALRSVRDGRDAMGNGWVPASDPMRDCGAADRFGWGCFSPGRVPVMVLVAEGAWYDGCVTGSPSTMGVGRTCADLTAALSRRGAMFVGVDLQGAMRDTWNNSLPLARDTGTVDEAGAPVLLAGAPADELATRLSRAFSTLAGVTRHDVRARAVADPMERRLPAGRSTSDFVRAVTPLRATPDAPAGFQRRDANVFYGASPTATAVFEAELVNDFAVATDAARVFTVRVEATGRATTVVDAKTIYVVVPAAAP